MAGCPFHKMLRHLKVFAGLPVPVTAKWVDGRPDFRQLDEDAHIKSIRFHLCSVCGRKLGLTCYWIGGPRSVESRFFNDSPMHKVCAEESMRLCPFLNGKRQDYRGDLPTMKIHHVEDGRPAEMFLLRGLTSAMEVRAVGNDAAIYAGDSLTVVKEF